VAAAAARSLTSDLLLENMQHDGGRVARPSDLLDASIHQVFTLCQVDSTSSRCAEAGRVIAQASARFSWAGNGARANKGMCFHCAQAMMF
jgi:hypothetical protein